MVELKDVLLIGAVGGAGLLAYKAVKGGLSGLSLPTIPQAQTTVDYSQADQFRKLLEDDRAQFADILKQLQGSASGGGSTTIINLPGTVDNGGDGNGNGGDGNDYSLSEISKIADAATFALEKSGAYGGFRKAEAATAEQFDTNNTERINSFGGLGGAVGFGDLGADKLADVASGAGLTPAAAGTVATVGSLTTGILTGNGVRSGAATLALAQGIQTAGEEIYNFFKGLF